MNTQEFGNLLAEFGFEDFVGVPCSFLSPLINYAINEGKFIMANNEGDAMAIASGISLAKRDRYGVVLMQNSGLSNALSPLTSLNFVFDIPILGFVSLRGERDIDGNNTDEPQHELMGVITDKMLEVCQTAYEFLSSDISTAREQLQRAKLLLDKNKPFFFIVKKGVLEDLMLQNTSSSIPSIKKQDPRHTRLEVLEVVSSYAKQNHIAILATTGKTGRELYEIEDLENQLYMVGSMGCVSSLGLGIALGGDKKVICIDGDGALLMRMGAMVANAYYTKINNKGNFCHILLDNQTHDSTGGQFTLSSCVDFLTIAKSCGYERVICLNGVDELQDVLESFGLQGSGGATFIYMPIKKGSKKDLGRPKVTPKQVAERIRKFLR